MYTTELKNGAIKMKKETLKQKAYNFILEKIINCDYSPNTMLNEEQLKRIFEKFYQADRSHSTEGNGLGLTVVKRIVDMYKGTIEVKSAPDEGCTFIITL